MFRKKGLDFGCSIWGDEEADYSLGNKYDLKLFFEYLICYKGVRRFYFTNFRRFNKFCWEIITELKAVYTEIKRIWVVRNYGFNISTESYPQGYGCLDFDKTLYVNVTNPETSFEESVCVCKSVLELSLFNVFSFKRKTYRRKRRFTLSALAFDIVMKYDGIRIVYNVYVPRELREYQPMLG